MVFNEGSPSLLNRAKIQGCSLVSVLWIDACKREGKLVSEKDYPPLNLHLYDENKSCKKTKYRVSSLYAQAEGSPLKKQFFCLTFHGKRERLLFF